MNFRKYKPARPEGTRTTGPSEAVTQCDLWTWVQTEPEDSGAAGQTEHQQVAAPSDHKLEGGEEDTEMEEVTSGARDGKMKLKTLWQHLLVKVKGGAVSWIHIHID